MSRAVRRDLLWFAALAIVLVGVRGYAYSSETVVFEGNLPDEREAITPLFQVHRDTGLRLVVTRTDGRVAQPLEVELLDGNGRLLGHEPMILDTSATASDALLFSVERGEAALRILRDVPARDPLHIAVIAGAQSHQHFGIAFFALLAPPLIRLAQRRRKTGHKENSEGSNHGT